MVQTTMNNQDESSEEFREAGKRIPRRRSGISLLMRSRSNDGIANGSNRSLSRNESSGLLRRPSRTFSGDGSSRSLLRGDSSKSLSRSLSSSTKNFLLKTLSKEDSNKSLARTESGRRLSRNLSGSSKCNAAKNQDKEGGSSRSFTRSLTRSFSGSTRSLLGLGDSTRSLTGSLSRCSLSSQDEAHQKVAAKEPYLLDQLGGMIVLKSIVQEFGRRVIRDPLLQPLLSQADPRLLHIHHERFFAIAFTEMDIIQTAQIIQNSHQQIITEGLGVEHYEAYQQHLVDCLADRGFGFAVLNSVLEVLAPMRDIFEQILEEHKRNTTMQTDEVEEELVQSVCAA